MQLSFPKLITALFPWKGFDVIKRKEKIFIIFIINFWQIDLSLIDEVNKNDEGGGAEKVSIQIM